MHNTPPRIVCSDCGIGCWLAGEMVVDEEEMDGSKQRRRFLIYDVMMLGGEGVADLRFAVRTSTACLPSVNVVFALIVSAWIGFAWMSHARAGLHTFTTHPKSYPLQEMTHAVQSCRLQHTLHTSASLCVQHAQQRLKAQ